MYILRNFLNFMDSGILDSRFLIESMVPKVDFVEVSDHYSFNENVICKYSLINYDVQEGDRIAIFKLGWNFVKEYILFEWVPRDDECFVTFNKLCLPKATLELYQFCFISGANNVLGASEPFQFCDKPKNYQSLFIKDIRLPDNSKSMISNFASMATTSDRTDGNQEMQKIKDENELLRNTLKAIVSERTKDYDHDIQQLKKVTFDLQKSLNMQQVQIKDLQIKLQNYRFENKKLENDNKMLQRNCTILRNKMDNKVHTIKHPLDFELGELQSLPPFPFAK